MTEHSLPIPRKAMINKIVRHFDALQAPGGREHFASLATALCKDSDTPAHVHPLWTTDYNFDCPVFFFEPAPIVDRILDIDEFVLPFEEFWLIFSSYDVSAPPGDPERKMIDNNAIHVRFDPGSERIDVVFARGLDYTDIDIPHGGWYSEEHFHTRVIIDEFGKAGIECDAMEDWTPILLAISKIAELANNTHVECERIDDLIERGRDIGAGRKPRGIRSFILVTSERRTRDCRGAWSDGSSAKSPHFRRAHYRHLSDGRIVPVRSSAIHGGSDPAQRYIVR